MLFEWEWGQILYCYYREYPDLGLGTLPPGDNTSAT
jgi:hypothetical protein